jgi:6-phosphogluconolactonase (cycloisomerase 2 family)
MTTQKKDCALNWRVVIVKHSRFRYHGRLYTRVVFADDSITPTNWVHTHTHTGGYTRKGTYRVLAKIGRDQVRIFNYDLRYPINPEPQAVA